MPGEVDVNMLAATLRDHMDGCGDIQRKTAVTLDELSTRLGHLTARFAAIDTVVKWVRRGAWTVVLTVLGAGTTVVVQNWVIQDQAAHAALAASHAVQTAQTTQQTTAENQELILKRLDAIQKASK